MLCDCYLQKKLFTIHPYTFRSPIQDMHSPDRLTLEPFSIHEYVTYMTTHVALIRTATKYAISMQLIWNSFEGQSVQLLFILDVLHALIPIYSSISLPLSYQKIEAEFFRNGIMLLVLYPPISFVSIRNAQQIGTGRVTKLSTVHVSTMHAQTIQPV